MKLRDDYFKVRSKLKSVSVLRIVETTSTTNFCLCFLQDLSIICLCCLYLHTRVVELYQKTVLELKFSLLVYPLYLHSLGLFFPWYEEIQ